MLGKKKGIKFSEEHKRKLSDALKKSPFSNKGKIMSEEQKEKIRKTHKKLGIKGPGLKGDKHPCWKGGITPELKRIRRSVEYKLWREAVFKRDNYTCIWCGDNKGGNLNADHIKPFAYFPELRFAIDNGRTLCIDCHKTTDTFGRKVYNYVSYISQS